MAKNRGLSHRFVVVNGSFKLSEGSEKVKDDLFFLMCFDTVSRIYKSDYAPKILWLVQKSTSFVNLYKTLLLGNLQKVVLKYISSIKIKSLYLISYRASGDFSYDVNIEYEYTDADGTVQDNVTKFI